jgi:hypothetical protein
VRTLFVVALTLLLPTAPAGAQRGAPFPHERHERLFPLCESCHAGIVTGDARRSMPDEASCRDCHNGTDVRVVVWRRAERPPGLLRFSHDAHARATDSTGRACATCHAAPRTSRMRVQRAAPPACLGCHTHRATEHLADDNRCAVCHVTLTSAPAISTERIAAFPRPASHERPGFVSVHAPVGHPASASCAVCHARESCARCHVNASSQPLIASLGRDTRVAGLVRGKAPVYPIPLDHQRDNFAQVHGDSARANVARCATCHARPSCTACHIGPLNAVLARVPVAERDGAQGIRLQLVPTQRRAPPQALQSRRDTIPAPKAVRVHDAMFRANHKAAGASSATCAGCHEQRFCSDCHNGESTRRFHAANFVQRHAADSYGRETQCSSCHNTELFCRSCHQTSGLATRGRLDAAFHDAQPQWLLNHGRAARQGLQSCATCHAQRDCLTCHSTLGWGVNPHGPGFRPERAASRNATQCLLCHLQVPRR